MKNTIVILVLLMLNGCSKNYVNKCFIDSDNDIFTVSDQQDNAYIKYYFGDGAHWRLRSLPPNGVEVPCSLVGRLFDYQEKN